jgi:23S rRNA (cytosine1962-C5)-methyltransferase
LRERELPPMNENDEKRAHSPRTVHVRVRKDVAGSVRRGHPWVYRRGLVRDASEARAGDVAVVHDEKNELVGVGLYDPTSEIAVRMLVAKKPVKVDRDFLRARIATAVALRAPLLDERDALGPLTDGYRVIFGEGDGLPGLIVDRYADVAVVKLYTAAWVPWLAVVEEALRDALAASLPVHHVVLRLARNLQSEDASHKTREGSVIFGGPLSDTPVFRERGLRFHVDPVRGQKTGFFLDQRDNRARVEAMSAEKSVLNVFSYTGGFSLAAARGGASRVMSVDLSKPALDDAERNFALNADVANIARIDHAVVQGDAFAVLGTLRARRERFDLVVLDPPAFAKNASQVPSALESYTRLASLGMDVLVPGGDLVFASCSAHVTSEMLVACTEAAARDRRRELRVSQVSGHAIDHPITFREGAYLKCVFAKVASPA